MRYLSMQRNGVDGGGIRLRVETVHRYGVGCRLARITKNRNMFVSYALVRGTGVIARSI
jgi:hypothetical protein